MIDVRVLDAAAATRELDGLARVLHDCVAAGASISYMAPFSHEDARAAFEGFIADAASGGRLLLAAFDGDDVVGTVQVVLRFPPNQPHRGEIAKLLVHPGARLSGVGRLLMDDAEQAARGAGKTLLVLDTATDDNVDFYRRLGWTEVGVIPGFALYPDGRPCDATFFFKEL